jgi:hypothetical protein
VPPTTAERASNLVTPWPAPEAVSEERHTVSERQPDEGRDEDRDDERDDERDEDRDRVV